MKIIICVLILSCIFISCKKDKTTDSPLVGRWEWFKSIKGMGFTITTPQNTGKTWSLTFGGDFNCSQAGDLNAATNGTYSLTEAILDSSPYSFINVSFFVPAEPFSYNFISSDTLEISNGSMEGQNHFFVRGN
ncbi:MAG: hypothetical protein ABI402_11495 [Ferruginibacter sp.]